MVRLTRDWQSRPKPTCHFHRKCTPELRGPFCMAAGGKRRRPTRVASIATTSTGARGSGTIRDSRTHTHVHLSAAQMPTYRQVHPHILQVLTLRQVDIVGGGQNALSAPPGAQTTRSAYRTPSQTFRRKRADGGQEKSATQQCISPTSQHPSSLGDATHITTRSAPVTDKTGGVIRDTRRGPLVKSARRPHLFPRPPARHRQQAPRQQQWAQRYKKTKKKRTT